MLEGQSPQEDHRPIGKREVLRPRLARLARHLAVLEMHHLGVKVDVAGSKNTSLLRPGAGLQEHKEEVMERVPAPTSASTVSH